MTGKTGKAPRSAPEKQAKQAKAPARTKGKAKKEVPRKAAKAAKQAVRKATPATPTKAKLGAAVRAAGRTVRKGKRPVVKQAAVPRTVKIRELDPVVKCGPDTSVQFLYRVDEQLGGAPLTAHLVFFDRHGWYCEHGRNCPAVADVRKHGKMHHLFGD